MFAHLARARGGAASYGVAVADRRARQGGDGITTGITMFAHLARARGGAASYGVAVADRLIATA